MQLKLLFQVKKPIKAKQNKKQRKRLLKLPRVSAAVKVTCYADDIQLFALHVSL